MARTKQTARIQHPRLPLTNSGQFSPNASPIQPPPPQSSSPLRVTSEEAAAVIADVKAQSTSSTAVTATTTATAASASVSFLSSESLVGRVTPIDGRDNNFVRRIFNEAIDYGVISYTESLKDYFFALTGERL